MARFFNDAPLIAISGRNFPIEVRYTAESEDVDSKEAEDPDLPTAVLNAYHDIVTTPGSVNGDVLVFLPGEREIRDVGDLLERELESTDVMALYSRLSWEQQSKIFQRGAKRRIVLATNVAETSITVPGIRAVIDSGVARVSRYSPRIAYSDCPSNPCRAPAPTSARDGAEGWVPDCVYACTPRLISRAARPLPNPRCCEPIWRRFCCVWRLTGWVTRSGFPSSILPIHARSATAIDCSRNWRRWMQSGALRAWVEPWLDCARSSTGACTGRSKRFRAETEVMAVVAALSVPDARIGGADAGPDVLAATAAFDDAKSEFFGLVKLWRAYRKAREGPRRELRRWCKERGLSLLRLSEWEDVHGQVVDRAKEIGIVGQPKAASYTALHRSLLAGFCTSVGTLGEDGAYVGTRACIFIFSPARR